MLNWTGPFNSLVINHRTTRSYEVEPLTASLNDAQNYTWRHITKDGVRRNVGASSILRTLVLIRLTRIKGGGFRFTIKQHCVFLNYVCIYCKTERRRSFVNKYKFKQSTKTHVLFQITVVFRVWWSSWHTGWEPVG